MLINLSNHPSLKWQDSQLTAAKKQYGEVVDLDFPQVSPDATKSDVRSMAEQYLYKVQNIGAPRDTVIHLMGEMTFTYELVNMLKAEGYTCIASTTIRDIEEIEPCKKVVSFKFVQFREY